jgi:hypothetical protein
VYGGLECGAWIVEELLEFGALGDGEFAAGEEQFGEDLRLQEIARRGIWSDDRAFLQPYMISLPTRIFNKLKDKKEVKPGLELWQWTSNYDPIRGFPLEQSDQHVPYDPMFLMG